MKIRNLLRITLLHILTEFKNQKYIAKLRLFHATQLIAQSHLNLQLFAQLHINLQLFAQLHINLQLFAQLHINSQLIAFFF